MVRTSGVEHKGPGGAGRLSEGADSLKEHLAACFGVVDGHYLIRHHCQLSRGPADFSLDTVPLPGLILEVHLAPDT